MLPVPPPSCALSFRQGALEDIPFMDALQKEQRHAVGFFRYQQFVDHIEAGGVLIAESLKQEAKSLKDQSGVDSESSSFKLPSSSFPSSASTPLGYIIHRDRYLKRDELGVVFQLNVRSDVQRGYVGAALLQAAFERSAYGCRLYCCWCAQDLAANRFWEAMGFVPLAYRAGGKGRKLEERSLKLEGPDSEASGFKLPPSSFPASPRVHIFWQKRITSGDSHTHYWYPFQTTGGALRADRLAFPIPPGTHWSEVRPMEVPMVDENGNEVKALPAAKPKRKAKATPKAEPERMRVFVKGKFQWVDVSDGKTLVPSSQPAGHDKDVVAPEAPARPKLKVKPAFLRLNRELRDRYLEELNRRPDLTLALDGKYDASRALPEADSLTMLEEPALPKLAA
ncbi:MAG: hypothetical protein AAGI46_13725 [Planctomycetota bacterium]